MGAIKDFFKSNFFSLINLIVIVCLFSYIHSLRNTIESMDVKLNELKAESLLNNVKMDYLESDINKRDLDRK